MDAPVYMNHGRWIVDCPNDGCAWAYSAMSVEEGSIWLPWQRRYIPRPLSSMVCNGDRNGPGCGHRFTLTWPEREDALEIERLLHARTDAANRNWQPPETVETLHNENERYLVGWSITDLAVNGIGVV